MSDGDGREHALTGVKVVDVAAETAPLLLLSFAVVDPDAAHLRASAGLGALLERAVAFGATAAIVWELAEFVAFLQFSPERRNAYTDTLGDLVLGLLGAVVAALVVRALGGRGRVPAGALTAPGSRAADAATRTA